MLTTLKNTPDEKAILVLADVLNEFENVQAESLSNDPGLIKQVVKEIQRLHFVEGEDLQERGRKVIDFLSVEISELNKRNDERNQ